MSFRYFFRSRRWLCPKFLYLIFLTSAFIFASFQFEKVQSFAKPILPNSESSFQNARSIGKNGDEVERRPIPSTIFNAESKIGPNTESLLIGSEKYPKLNSVGNFIPMRRIIHLDLKGGAYKPEFFTQLFYFFKRIQATGILLEWEDMFPYQGVLGNGVNGNAYSVKDVESILAEAQRHNLLVIPLVQTVGHLEWILKLEKFAHLREDSRFPQVICFSDSEAWELITDMIDQVATMHKKFNMPFFHMGADEVFQYGVCNASIGELNRHGSRERLLLGHIAKTASYIKSRHKTTVLAWHDMLAQVMESDLLHYNVTELLQPVLWSYAEDLDMYLPRSTWSSLTPFRHIWGSSAWKGADGPARFNSNPMHYVKNHESWTEQFTRVYKDFDVVEGLIMTGWSRYDHLAVLCELLPVAIPGLSMSMETVLEGRQLGDSFSTTAELLQCSPPTDMGFQYGCQFPGRKVYELINDLWQRRKQLRQYQEDYELNGWLSRVADSKHVSSLWYINKIQPVIESMYESWLDLQKSLRTELNSIYYQDTVEEFLFTYLAADLDWMRQKLDTSLKISQIKVFPRRPQFLTQP